MQFDRIHFDGKLVELDHKTTSGGVASEITDKGKDPSPGFKNALKAFVPYVLWVHELPHSHLERIDVRGVSIKRGDDKPLGINVSGVLTCPRARSAGSTLNTPYLTEPPEGYVGDRKGFLPETIGALVENLEEMASAYLAGERGEQTTLPLESENAKAFDDRAAAAEVQSTRKPKGRKGKTQIPGVGDVMNPNSDVALDDAGLRQLLLSCDHDVPIDAVARWSSSERDAAQLYGMAQQRKLAGEKVDVPALPKAIKRDATLPLKAEDWSSEPPPKIDEAGAQEVREAAVRA